MLFDCKDTGKFSFSQTNSVSLQLNLREIETRINKRILLASVDSTNNEARRRLDNNDELPEISVIIADEQTSGRGQRGNSWEAEAGKNLLFSIVCHPDFLKASEQFVLSQAIALAVALTVNEVVVTDECRVKWPNDIYIGNKKVSGTLIECDLRGSNIETCIIGTGININQEVFHSDAPNPVSMAQIAGKEFDREAILSQILGRFINIYDVIRQGDADAVRRLYKVWLYRKSGFYKYADANGEFLAEIADVEKTGHLVLRLENGELRRYEFKDVKIVI